MPSAPLTNKNFVLPPAQPATSIASTSTGNASTATTTIATPTYCPNGDRVSISRIAKAAVDDQNEQTYICPDNGSVPFQF